MRNEEKDIPYYKALNVLGWVAVIAAAFAVSQLVIAFVLSHFN